MKFLIHDQNKISRAALNLLLRNQWPSAAVVEVQLPEEIALSDLSRETTILLITWDSLTKQAESRQWVEYIRHRDRRIRVIAMSGRPEVSAVACQTGADAFVCKCDPPERLLSVLEGLIQGAAGFLLR